MGTTAEKLAYLNDTKTAIRDAIVAKGVEVPEGTPFRQYAEKVGEIESGATDTITVTIKASFLDTLAAIFVDSENNTVDAFDNRNSTHKAIRGTLLYARGYNYVPLIIGGYTSIDEQIYNDVTGQFAGVYKITGDIIIGA